MPSFGDVVELLQCDMTKSGRHENPTQLERGVTELRQQADFRSISPAARLCLSEFKLARTDDEVRREMA